MTGARTFGKLLKANWTRDAWRQLSTDAQWLYAYLMSQPTTDTAGVFPLHTGRWAKANPDMTEPRVKAAARLLVDTGWIAVDFDTDEGLIRNYIRDDWAGDLIFKGALKRCLLVQSVRLRAILLVEVTELKCERPIFKDDQLSLIADLESLIPQGFDVESVVAFVPASPAPSPKPSPKPFERRSNADRTPFDSDGPPTCQQCDEWIAMGDTAGPGDNPKWCCGCNDDARADARGEP
jgi:hypothetical protein